MPYPSCAAMSGDDLARDQLIRDLRAVFLPRPRCRDCADNDGTCPHDGRLCDPYHELKPLAQEALAELESTAARLAEADAVADYYSVPLHRRAAYKLPPTTLDANAAARLLSEALARHRARASRAGTGDGT